MKLRFINDIWPLDPRYPDAWRGEIGVRLFAFNTTLRLRYFPAKRENNWMRISNGTRFEISPRWAKWFQINSYYAGHSRYMYHFMIGHIGMSILPGDCTW